MNFQACSGAKTTDLNANQLGPLNSATSLVTITIGGNDAGFSSVILNGAVYYFTCGSSINSAYSFIQNQLPGLLDTTYNNIPSRATQPPWWCSGVRTCSPPTARRATSTP